MERTNEAGKYLPKRIIIDRESILSLDSLKRRICEYLIEQGDVIVREEGKNGSV